MGYLAEGGYVVAVVLLSRLLHGRCGVGASTTRKLVHILIGFVFPIQYYFFREDALGMLLLPAIITITLFLVARYRLIPAMVNPENPYGIFYYALGILVLNLVAVLYPAMHAAEGAAVFALAFGDGAATLLTPLFKKRHKIFRGKTVEGTLLCFLFAALGMLLLGLMLPALMLPPLLILGVAALTALIELFTGRYDNLAILFGVAALCLLVTTGGALC